MRSMRSFGASALRWASGNNGVPSNAVKLAVTIGVPEDVRPELRDPQVQAAVKAIDEHVSDGIVIVAHSMGGLMSRTAL